MTRIWRLAAGLVLGAALGGCSTDLGYRAPLNVRVQKVTDLSAKIPASAGIFVTPGDRAYELVAKVPGGHWTYAFGAALPEAARDAFAQVFESARVVHNTQDAMVDFSIALKIDPAASSASLGLVHSTVRVGLLASMRDVTGLDWNGSFSGEAKTSGTEKAMKTHGDALAIALQKAAASLYAAIQPQVEAKQKEAAEAWAAGETAEKAGDHASALKQFARAYQSSWGPLRVERLEKLIRSAAAMRPRPVAGEESHRSKVLGNAALQEKRYNDAAADYAQALRLAPWDSELWFNRALLLAEMGAYSEAVVSMKRYLVLEPESADARAAQDKIYVWEEKARRPAASGPENQ